MRDVIELINQHTIYIANLLLEKELKKMKKRTELYKRFLLGESLKSIAESIGITQKYLRSLLEKAEREDKGAWIPIEDSLPALESDVLVTVKYEHGSVFVCSGYYDGKNWYTQTEHSCQIVGSNMLCGKDRVIAWMPKPVGYMQVKFDIEYYKKE